MANILIDSSSKHLRGSGWVTIPNDQTIGGSVARSNGKEELTSFSVSFNGTSISFFIVNSLLNSLNLPPSSTVTIDGTQTFEVPVQSVDIQNPSLLVEKHWFSTPILSDSTHTVSATDFPRNFSLDYALVTPGRQTPIADELLVVDDDSTLLTYSNTWYRNTSTYLVPLPPGQGQLSLVPLNGVTHHASTIFSLVDTFVKFNFTGTSVYIYGILEGSINGTEKLTVVYTLDGFKTQQDYYPASQTQANFLWFSNTTIPLGLHTVQIDILQLNGVDFILDYILYNPSPHPPDQTNPFVNPFAPSGENGDGPLSPSSKSKYTKTVIIASIVGGVVGIAVIIGLILIWRRLKSRKYRSNEIIALNQTRDDRKLNGRSNDHSGPRPLSIQDRASSPSTNPSHDDGLIVRRKPTLDGAQQRLSQDQYTDIVHVEPHGNVRSQVLVTPFTLGIRPTAPPVANSASNDGDERPSIHTRLQALQNLAHDIRREMAEARNGRESQVPSLSSTAASSRDVTQEAATSGRVSTGLYPPPYREGSSTKDARLQRFLDGTTVSR
ncbi:hypothetical protein H0H87_009084 [Tephrocybe sp. NHM501043]|nr:hypothetical protein H0H87_009084 [Tephrocybe sp. NHM501043]